MVLYDVFDLANSDEMQENEALHLDSGEGDSGAECELEEGKGQTAG